MLLSQAFDADFMYSPEEYSALSDPLSPELIKECLTDTRVVTVCKRSLTMEMIVWAVTGISLFCSLPMNQLVSHLDIPQPEKRPFMRPSAVVQFLQMPRADAVHMVFEQTRQLWYEKTLLSH